MLELVVNILENFMSHIHKADTQILLYFLTAAAVPNVRVMVRSGTDGAGKTSGK